MESGRLVRIPDYGAKLQKPAHKKTRSLEPGPGSLRESGGPVWRGQAETARRQIYVGQVRSDLFGHRLPNEGEIPAVARRTSVDQEGARYCSWLKGRYLRNCRRVFMHSSSVGWPVSEREEVYPCFTENSSQCCNIADLRNSHHLFCVVTINIDEQKNDFRT